MDATSPFLLRVTKVGVVLEATAERKLRELCEGESGRYVMQIGSDYVLCYGVNNPAGLANDAGSKYANVRELASGRMIASRERD